MLKTLTVEVRRESEMSDRLICPVCNNLLIPSYSWIYGCETEGCEMNGLLLMVVNDSAHREAFERVRRWIQAGRAIEINRPTNENSAK